MVNYLVFNSACKDDFLPRIGGGACLPIEIDWPKDKDEKPMLLLMTLSAEVVNQNAQYQLPEGYCVSVFIPYKTDSIEHVIDLARKPDAACIFAHKIASDIRQENPCPLSPPHALIIESDEDAEDEDEFSDEIESKIGGTPTWLQDRIEVKDKKFLLQIVGSLIDRYWQSHRGLFMGGVGYLFVDSKFDDSKLEVGEFRVQYT